jgi:undecaprenyl-diphosphatase
LNAEAPKINSFDANIIHFVNQLAQKSWLLDRSVSFVSNNLLTCGGVIAALFWWAWFRGGETKTRDRELVLSGIVMSCAALFVARALALTLPYRERPLRVPEVGFRLPFGATSSNLIHWSSFPSDHAALFFSLATCLYLISRRIGILAYCHAFFIVCLPIVYTGMHYPTDVLAGAFLGISISQLATIQSLRETITRAPLRWAEEFPEFFYPGFYLMTFLIGTVFDPVRAIGVAAWQGIRVVVQHRL